MTLTYRSSVLFSQPSTFTITHMNVQDALYNHKRKLQINFRSKIRNQSYKIQRLSSAQARTIENLSKSTRAYSLNTLLKTYNKQFQLQQEKIKTKKLKNQTQLKNSQQNYFKSKLIDQTDPLETICPQKFKLFKAGVNYRSTERARGVGVNSFKPQDLKQYYQRCPQQEIELNHSKQLLCSDKKIKQQLPFKKYNTIDFSQKERISRSSFRSIVRSKYGNLI